MATSFMDEILKIPPVTRFLCASTLIVSVPVMLQLVSPYKVLFVKELIVRRMEVSSIDPAAGIVLTLNCEVMEAVYFLVLCR